MSNKRCKSLTELSEEILMDILVRVPVKPLVRFMCVSKSCKRLISSSCFVSTHLKNVKKYGSSCLVVLHQDPKDKRTSCYSLFRKEAFSRKLMELRELSKTIEHFRVYGSSNGLLCISDRLLDQESQICLWNPSIRKIRTLPMFIPEFSNDKPDIALSFGFHLELNDYKVVRMMHFSQLMSYNVVVDAYTFSTDSWKRIDVVPDSLKSAWMYWGCEFWNGVAYWLIFNRKDSIFRIVSFDTGNETFQDAAVPNSISENSLSTTGNLCITVYKESACLLEVDFGCDFCKKHVDIWSLQEPSFKKLGSFVIHDPQLGSRQLCFCTDTELLVEDTDFARKMVDLALYNIESEQVDRTGIRLMHSRHRGEGAIYGSLNNAFTSTYVESLVLLNH